MLTVVTSSEMIFYARENSKKGGKSARQVSEMVKRDFSVDISPHAIQDYMSKGNVGLLPLQRGPVDMMPEVFGDCGGEEVAIIIREVDRGGRRTTRG